MTDLNPSARRQIRQRQIGQRVRRLVNSISSIRGGSAPIQPQFDTYDLATMTNAADAARTAADRIIRAGAISVGISIDDVPGEYFSGDRTGGEIRAMLRDLASRKTALPESLPEGYESDETLEVPVALRIAGREAVRVPPAEVLRDPFGHLGTARWVAPPPRARWVAVETAALSPPNEGVTDESKDEDEHLQEEKFPDDESEMSFQE